MAMNVNFLRALADWVRAGYPEGVPQQDYIPLLALLRRKLTSEEADAVASLLADSAKNSDASNVDPIELRSQIAKTIDGLPGEEDIARVERRLNDVGWRVERLA